jgi:poly-gamma-glutamate capsule biosynthesis protein CapA/YwtB (metallophosphatase superfamily)
MKTRPLLALALLLAGCGSYHAPPLDPPPAPPPPFDAALVAVDEGGLPVAGAFVAVDGGAPLAAGADGRLALPGLLGPVLAVVSAPGFLPEPVVLAREDEGTDVRVRLLARTGPGGARRTVLHFGGDTHFGRRFQAPDRPDTFVVESGDGGASARALVAAIAPLFAAADVRSLSLDSTIGSLPFSASYPEKKAVIQSPPEACAGLDALGVNAAALAGAHARDWLEPGVVQTLAELDGAGVAHVGAGLDGADAAAALTASAAPLRVSVLDYTSMSSDLDDDLLPLDEDPIPPGLPPGCCDWQFQLRTFGFSGQTITITPTAHRIGDAWQNHIQPALNSGASPDEIAALWSAASAVYPELLDFLARRGHGGANGLPTSVAGDVAAARAGGADLVVVEIHGGLEDAVYRSRGVDRDAHAAIDAGADLVVCHHPQVLERIEWYRGKLVAYSVGDFVSDENILDTYATFVLRVVFEEQSLLEARVLPVLLDRYRPAAAGGARARDIVETLQARSILDAETATIAGVQRNVLAAPAAGVVAAGFLFERNSARIVTAGAVPLAALAVSATADAATDLPPGALTRSRGPGGATLTALLFGQDLYRYGSFEDDLADGEALGGAEWLVDRPYKRVEPVAGAPSGIWALRLRRSGSDSQPIFSRPVSRVGVAPHRLYVDQGGGFVAPADGLSSYSVRLRARFDGDGPAPTSVRFEVYHFDDSSPIDPTVNELLRDVEIPYAIPADGAWHEVLIDLTPDVLAPGPIGEEANELFFELVLDAPQEGKTILFADDVQFLEWREAEFLPDGFFQVDALRARDPGTSVGALLERLGG